MTAPSVICQRAAGRIAIGNPCQLSPQEEGSGIGDWTYLINHRPPDYVKSLLNYRFHGGVETDPGKLYHCIEDGYGDVNLDFYPVFLHELPPAYTLEKIVEHVRWNINDFVDPTQGNFEPYDVTVDSQWVLSDPNSVLGTVIHIDMLTPKWLCTVYNNPDDGSVVVTEATRRHWIFSTLWTPDDYAHPVSGNRQFGAAILPAEYPLPDIYSSNLDLRENQGNVPYFFTRGADRCTGAADWTVSGVVVFPSADRLWRSLQDRVCAWVNRNGGHARIPGRISVRKDWATDIVYRGGWHRPPR